MIYVTYYINLFFLNTFFISKKKCIISIERYIINHLKIYCFLKEIYLLIKLIFIILINIFYLYIYIFYIKYKSLLLY